MKFILSRNIVCGNALSLKVVDDEGNDTDEPIIFSEWAFVMGDKMQRNVYRFDKLIAGDYEPSVMEKETTDEYRQMELTAILEKEPSDEGEFLTSYVADYRRIHEYGK